MESIEKKLLEIYKDNKSEFNKIKKEIEKRKR